MKNKRIVIAGGSGFIGQALTARWGKDNTVVILSRQLAKTQNNAYNKPLTATEKGDPITVRHWDGRQVERSWADELEGCDLVLNLAGRSVNCRYTPLNKQEIFDSRTDATRTIGEAIRATVAPPKLWINAASATIYRHAEDQPQDEYTGETGEGFSVEVCRRWEKTFFGQRTPFTRKIAIRTAITLGAGGVMIPYLRLLKFGLGGRQGSGHQMYSWIHIDDVARAIEWLLDKPELEGIFNLAAPAPVTNSFFMSALRRQTGRTLGIATPGWLLRLGAQLIGTETELLLKSRWVVPTRLLESGFTFRYQRIEPALKDILSMAPRKKYHLF
jgi:uncharacterized protein (TIGR01777 family)